LAAMSVLMALVMSCSFMGNPFVWLKSILIVNKQNMRQFYH